MKILQAAKLYPPPFGGIETVVERLSRGLVDLIPEIEVQVLATHPLPSTKWMPLEDRLSLKKIQSLGTFARTPIALEYAGQLSEAKVDIMHFHFPYPWAEFSQLCSKSRAPYIVTYHSDIVKQRYLKKIYAPLMRRFLDRAEHIVVASPHIIESSELLRTRYRAKTRVIPLGIDTKRFVRTDSVQEKAQCIKNSISPNKHIVFFLGRLVYYKGIDYLLEAVQRLDVHLILGGDGPLASNIKDRIKQLGIVNRVHLIPKISDQDLPAFYHAADLFVLPSTDESEAFGLVQLEAHASGIPVVSTNLPTGVTFINQHGKTGLCIPPRSAQALAEAISELLNAPETRKIQGEYAKQRAIREFDATGMCQKYYQLYEQVLGIPHMS